MKWLIPIGVLASVGALLSIALLAWMKNDPSQLFKASVPGLFLLLLLLRKKNS